MVRDQGVQQIQCLQLFAFRQHLNVTVIDGSSTKGNASQRLLLSDLAIDIVTKGRLSKFDGLKKWQTIENLKHFCIGMDETVTRQVDILEPCQFGWLGGYNFQWAWSSAHACAHGLAQRLLSAPAKAL